MKHIPASLIIFLFAVLPSSAQSMDTSQEQLKALAQKLSIEIQTDLSESQVSEMAQLLRDGDASADKPTPHVVDQYLQLFVAEFSRYPAEVIAKTQLRKIVFCQNLALQGVPKMGVCVRPSNILYLNITTVESSKDLREALHHEFFHMIDRKINQPDSEWESMNAPSFHYGKSNSEYESGSGEGPLQKAGFVSPYSQVSASEDKAEVFARIMVDHPWVSYRALGDPILEAKVEHLKKLLYSFSNSFDSAFWAKIQRQGEILSDEKKTSSLDSDEAVENLDRLSRYFCSKGRYTEAVSLATKSLVSKQRKLGYINPTTAKSLLELSGMYFKQNKPAEARQIFSRALGVIDKLQLSENIELRAYFIEYSQFLRMSGHLIEASDLDTRISQQKN